MYKKILQQSILVLLIIQCSANKFSVTKGQLIQCENKAWYEWDLESSQSDTPYVQNQIIRDICDINTYNKLEEYQENQIIPQSVIQQLKECKNKQYVVEQNYPAYLVYSYQITCINKLENYNRFPYIFENNFTKQTHNECDNYCAYMFTKTDCVEDDYIVCEFPEIENHCEEKYYSKVKDIADETELSIVLRDSYYVCKWDQGTESASMINSKYHCEAACSSELYFNYDLPQQYYDIYLKEVFIYKGYDYQELSQCFEDCNSNCGSLCEEEITYQIKFTQNQCKPEFNFIEEDLDEQQMNNRANCYQNIENIENGSVGIYSKQNLHCKKVNCIDQYLKFPRELEVYDDKKYLKEYEQASRQFILNDTKELDECEQKCEDDCDQDCQERIAHKFDISECEQSLLLQQKQEKDSIQSDYLGGSLQYQMCLQQNINENFEQNSNSQQTIQCKKECADSEIDKIKQQITSDCEGSTCYRKILMCIEDCEFNNCTGLECMSLTIQETFSNVFNLLAFSCQGLGAELKQQSSQEFYSVGDLPMRTAAELISCSRQQQKMVQKNDIIKDSDSANKMFECTKQCAAKSSSERIQFAIVIGLIILSTML